MTVLQPGLCSLLMDFGRPSARALGIPLGGAADRLALAAGNALVGNPPDAVGLEVTLGGPTLRAERRVGGVLFGAEFDLSSDRQTLTPGRTFMLEPGEVLRVGGARAGVRAYLCVPGGFDAPIVLGSRSALGPVRVGDVLDCRESALPARSLAPALCGPWRAGGTAELRCLPGGEADWFDLAAFAAGAYTIRPESNRMGLRLAGQPLDRPRREILSEPAAPGTVQVTNEGSCVVLGVDAQTIGGYPKIAQVIRADLDVLGRLRPGSEVRFRLVSVDEAEAAADEARAFWSRHLGRVRAAGGA